MFVRDIRRYLKAGYKPNQIRGAKQLGCGSDKVVYLIGDYVVKPLDYGHCHIREYHKREYLSTEYLYGTRKMRREFFRLGVSRIKRWVVETIDECWSIQPYVTPWEKDSRFNFDTPWGWSGVLDLHAGNVAKVNDKFVAFDW